MGNRDSVLISQKAGMINYSTFKRIIERIQIQKNIIITMGYEIFVSCRDIPESKSRTDIQKKIYKHLDENKG
jgi:hypothetical protein